LAQKQTIAAMHTDFEEIRVFMIKLVLIGVYTYTPYKQFQKVFIPAKLTPLPGC
jgi:hypothetical protein